MLVPHKLKNAPWQEETTIEITNTDKEWQEGENPTDSPEWKKGVYLSFKEKLCPQ